MTDGDRRPTGAPAAPVAGNAVAITGFAFSPAALTVKAGTTVTWTNKDSDAHTVTSQGSGGPLAIGGVGHRPELLVHVHQAPARTPTCARSTRS